MAGLKRHLENFDAHETANGQVSKKRRSLYTDADAQKAKVYNELADEIESVRLKAASSLVRSLVAENSDRAAHIDTAITRLIKGLCSGRKAARLGFSVALSEVLRLKFDVDSKSEKREINLTDLLHQIIELTRPDGNVKGQEKRDHVLGRRFAFQAILHSDVALRPDLPNEQWVNLVKAIFDLAGQKQWIRRECGAMLHEFLTNPTCEESAESKLRVQAIIDSLAESGQAKTPEGVGLWLAISGLSLDVTLPKEVWHHSDPLASKERQILRKVLLANSNDDELAGQKNGYRQSAPTFAWQQILKHLFLRKDNKDFGKFWDEIVIGGMFSSSSSAERKSLGLQVLSLAITTSPREQLPRILHRNVIHYIIDQRSSKDRYLFEAAKVPLSKIVARANEESVCAPVLLKSLLDNEMLNLDQLTKTKTMEALVTIAENESLTEIIGMAHDGIVKSQRADKTQVESMRRALADFLLLVTRLRKDCSGVRTGDTNSLDFPVDCWPAALFDTFFGVGYFSSDISEPMSDSTVTIFQSRLMSCLGLLLANAPPHVIWVSIYRFRRYLNPGVKELKRPKLGKNALRAVLNAGKCLEDVSQLTSKTEVPAFPLLLLLSILQVLNDEPDAVPVLEDVTLYLQSRDSDDTSSTAFIELLLSFISKPSALFRKIAEQVFSSCAADVTADSLQSLVDILQQKESLKGQQELFDRHDDDQEKAAETEDGISDGVEDIEDASDVEIVNGNAVTRSDLQEDGEDEEEDEDDDSDDEIDESSSVEDGIDEDEEAAFDRKLADALGTTGMDAKSDDDGSDMDDDQMMALEPHLNSIFKERQAKSSKSKEKKDAREHITNFKNRVLDLLLIYVKTQFDSVLALDLILPLTILVRTTTSKQIAEKAFAVLKQYFDSTTKHKSLPQQVSQEACFEILTELFAEMKLGGSKLQASACSRSSLFIARVLMKMDDKNFERVGAMYVELLGGWRSDPKSKVHQSVFTDWMSWSVSAKKRD